MTKEIDVVLRGRQGLTLGNADLPLHEVKPRDALSYRMLDLQARIHLQKIKFAAGIQKKFHSTRAHVAHRARRFCRRSTHRLAQLWRHDGARGFLDHFLVPPL